MEKEICSVQDPQEACSHDKDGRKTEMATVDTKEVLGIGILQRSSASGRLQQIFLNEGSEGGGGSWLECVRALWALQELSG